MEKVNLTGSFLDRETGHTYYPGLHTIDEDIPANTAQRALNDGLAEAVEEDEEPAQPEEPQAPQPQEPPQEHHHQEEESGIDPNAGEPEHTDQEWVG